MTTIKKLTEGELEIMAELWKLNEGTATDVQRALAPEKKLAYTSVSTMLRILEKKGFVTARKEGRGHVYVPAVAKEKYEAQAVDHAVKKIFGSPAAMVRQLLNSQSLSKRDLDEIRQLLDAREAKKGK